MLDLESDAWLLDGVRPTGVIESISSAPAQRVRDKAQYVSLGGHASISTQDSKGPASQIRKYSFRRRAQSADWRRSHDCVLHLVLRSSIHKFQLNSKGTCIMHNSYATH